MLVSVCLILTSAACGDPTQDAIRHADTAQQAFEAGDLRRARAAIAEAIAGRDDVVEYQLLRARIELAAGSRSGAYDAYSDALALDATNGEALLGVAQLGLSTGNLRASLEAAERISALAPDQTEALLVRGIHSLVKRQYGEAIAFAERILTLAPAHEGGTVLKARALFFSSEPEQALETLNRLPPDAARSEAVSLTKLEIYRAQRRPVEMAAMFERLRELRADDLSLRLDEANLRFKRNDRAEAHARIAEVLSSPKADAGTAADALALWREYGWRDAPAAIATATGRKGSPEARQALARFFIEHGHTAGARRVLAFLPAAEGAGLSARLLLREGRAGEAEKAADALLAFDATNCDALVAGSEAALRRRGFEKALRLGQRAAAECPNLEAAWLAGARAYMGSGQHGGVNRMYAQGLDANKQSALLTRSYAEWLLSRGREREALAIARRLTRYAPALVSGWRLYESLCRAHDGACVGDARRGLANASTMFGVDLPPGARPPNGLFGRLTRR